MTRQPNSKRTTSNSARGSTPPSAGERPQAGLLTPYSLDNDEVERSLVTGAQVELLEDYFGEGSLVALQRLAREASARSLRGGDRVLILPGMMGSTLGFRREGEWDDVVWLDPNNLGPNSLNVLELGKAGAKAIKPLGVALFSYLALKYRLRSSGLDAEFYPFDWRLDLRLLGKELAERIRRESSGVHLVAHGTGGLVARAALEHQPENLRRIITLGTPHSGSFSSIQICRGVHPIAGRIARLGAAATPDDLGRVFSSFPGLCEALPASSQSKVDYHTLQSWPSSGVRPSPELLMSTRNTLSTLPTGYADLTQIIGSDRETVIAASVVDDVFVYAISLDGDGTVPISLARLPDSPAYYIAEEHGSLPNNPIVAGAVVDILTTGRTAVLPDQRGAIRVETARALPERMLRVDAAPRLGDETRLAPRVAGTREARDLLQGFANPFAPAGQSLPHTPSARAVPSQIVESSPAFCDRIVIGRRHQIRLDLTLAFGNIAEVDASACVLGLFGQVSPGGAAKAIDALMDGAITQMSDRRMLSANIGGVSFLPKGRHPVRADLIAFVGLGPFDSFKEETLEAATENLIRTLLLTGVDDFAMVPLGGGTGIDPGMALHYMMAGFTRGLIDADGDHRFRGITICEIDRNRYGQLQRELYRLCGTNLFDNVEVTLREKALPAPRTFLLKSAPAAQPIYLIVRQEDGDNGKLAFTASLLTSGDKAVAFPARQDVDPEALDAHLQVLPPAGNPNIGDLAKLGQAIGELVLSGAMRDVLSEFAAEHLVVVHDASASRIPWEILHFGNHAPALAGGISHRYEAQDLSTAKWLQKRKQNRVLNILLIINPTGDLRMAETEGERIGALLADLGPAVRVTSFRGDAARLNTLLAALSSGEFDVVHYAGHAFFDADNPQRSGIVCSGKEVLSGASLAALANLPSLMFFNACEAARIRRSDRPEAARGERGPSRPVPSMAERLRHGGGFAEALLRGGVANYVGTYWPVRDIAANDFADHFYRSLLSGRTLGEAIVKGRLALKAAGDSDWANYVLYGDPNFVLKAGAGQEVG